MNSVRGAAMHEASVNNKKSTVIVFMNEVDALLLLIIATLAKVWNSHNPGTGPSISEYYAAAKCLVPPFRSSEEIQDIPILVSQIIRERHVFNNPLLSLLA